MTEDLYTSKQAARMITAVDVCPDDILDLRRKGVVKGRLAYGRQNRYRFTRAEIRQMERYLVRSAREWGRR